MKLTARLQLPATCLFTRPDSKAWDYPHVNPYLYCVANPITFTDPTGEELHYYDDVDEEDYIYKIENGKIVVYDTKNNVVDISKLSENQQDTIDDLNKIITTDVGAEAVNELINAETITTIVFDKENSYDAIDNVIKYNPYAESKSLMCSYNVMTSKFENISKSHHFVSLSHEIFHAQDNLNGSLDSSPWYTSAKGYVVRKADIYACNKENILRKELNLPIRLTYSFIRKGNSYFPEWKGLIPPLIRR